MADAPGVKLQEKRNGGVPPTQGVPSSVAGFVGVTERGPTRVTSITSFAQFLRIFGSYIPTSYMAESVSAFFKNGGQRCYISRVIDESGGNAQATFDLLTAATGPTKGSLSSGANAFPVALLAGDTFTGSVNGGGGATATIAATPATKTLTGGTYAAGAGGDSITFSVVIMGVTILTTVDLSAVAGTQAAYTAALNGVPGLKSETSGADILLTTDQKGSGAAANITALGGAAAAKLGATVSAFTNAGPNNAVNVAQVTAAELATLFEATFAGSTSTAPTATSFKWETDTAGAGGSVQLTAGTGVAKITGFDNLLHSGAASGGGLSTLTVDAASVGEWGNNLSVKVSNIDTKVGALEEAFTTGDTFATMTSFTAKKLAPGDQVKLVDSTGLISARGIVKAISGKKVTFTAAVTFSGGPIPSSNSAVYNETFSLTVYEDTGIIYGQVRDLRMSSLSLRNYVVTRINKDGLDPEVPILVTDNAVAVSSTTDPRPVNTSSDATGDALTGGTESTAYADVDYTAAGVGIRRFDKTRDVRLLSTPGVTGITVTGAISKDLVEYCLSRGDVTAIIEPPAGTAIGSVVAYKDDNLPGASFGGIFYPWVLIQDPNSGQPVVCPPSGFVCGAIARTHNRATIGVSQAAAGEEFGVLVGTVGLEGLLPGTDWEDADAANLNDNNVNLIRNVSGVGQVIMGDRTLEAGEFLYLHIRLAFVYFEQTYKEATRFAVFAPPTEQTRARVRRTLDAINRPAWIKGTLAGATYEESNYIICDDSNNPASVGNAGRTEAEVGINIPGTTELLVITVGRDQRALEAELGG